jgi:hypothetical protein
MNKVQLTSTKINSEINCRNIWCGHLKKWVKRLMKVSSACPNTPGTPEK